MEHLACNSYAKRNCCGQSPTHYKVKLRMPCSVVLNYIYQSTYYSVFLWKVLSHVHTPQVADSPEMIHLWGCTSLLLFLYLYILPVSVGQ